MREIVAVSLKEVLKYYFPVMIATKKVLKLDYSLAIWRLYGPTKLYIAVKPNKQTIAKADEARHKLK